MSEVLSKNSLNKIKEYLETFKKYMQTEDYKEDEDERRRRETTFKILDRDYIENLTESEFRQIVYTL